MGPFKNQTKSTPHQRTKNQMFLFVPFRLNHSNTNPSTNKSNDKRAKNQIPKSEKMKIPSLVHNP
jgi:hypothetical protein